MLKFTNGIVGWKFYKWVFVEKSRIKPIDLHALSWPSQLFWLSSGFFETGKLLSFYQQITLLLNWLWVVSLFLLFSFQGSVCAAFQRRVISYHSFVFPSSSFFWTFSFQREDLACQVLTAINILSEIISLVKNFFIFFAAFSVFQQWIVYYHIVSDLSTTIYNFFGTFSLCSDSEVYITIDSHFCQHFFSYFFIFLISSVIRVFLRFFSK